MKDTAMFTYGSRRAELLQFKLGGMSKTNRPDMVHFVMEHNQGHYLTVNKLIYKIVLGV
jgi:hypothetical protein